MTQRRRAASTLLVVCVGSLAIGCGGSGSTAATPTPTSAPSTAARPGGFIGAIDMARLEAVCTNAREADTALQGGMGAATVDPILTSIGELLQRPPLDPAVQALAAPLRRDVTAGQRERAVTAVLTFCRRNHA